MPSKQEKSGRDETGLTEPAATPCNAIMTSSRCRNLHDVFLILTAVDCGNLTDPANGSVNHTAGTTFGQTATYSCNTCYNLVGDRTRTCQATGIWSGSEPTCQGVLLKDDLTLFIYVHVYIIVSCKYAPPPPNFFCNLSLSTKRRGGFIHGMRQFLSQLRPSFWA